MSPEALPTRVSLGVTILLTLSYQHTKSQDSLPHVSYFKLVDAFMVSSTLFVFSILVQNFSIAIMLVGSELKRPRKIIQMMKIPEICKVRSDGVLFAVFQIILFVSCFVIP